MARIEYDDFQFEGRIEASTAKAILVEPTVGTQVWVPRSQIVSQEEIDEGLYVFVVTGWWHSRPDNKEHFY